MGRGRSPPRPPPPVMVSPFDSHRSGRQLARARQGLRRDFDDDTSDFDSGASSTITSPYNDVGGKYGHGHGHGRRHSAYPLRDEEWVHHAYEHERLSEREEARARDRALALAEAKHFLSPLDTETLHFQNEFEHRRGRMKAEVVALMETETEARRFRRLAMSSMRSAENMRAFAGGLTKDVERLKRRRERRGSYEFEVQHYSRARRSRREESAVHIERFRKRRH